MDVEVPSWQKFMSELSSMIVEGSVNTAGNLILKNRSGVEMNAGSVIRPVYINKFTMYDDTVALNVGTNSPGTYLFNAIAFSSPSQFPLGPQTDYSMENDGLRILTLGIYEVFIYVWNDPVNYAGTFFGCRNASTSNEWEFSGLTPKIPSGNTLAGVARVHIPKRQYAANEKITVSALAATQASNNNQTWRCRIEAIRYS